MDDSVDGYTGVLYSLDDDSHAAKVVKIVEKWCYLTLFMKVIKDDLSFGCAERFCEGWKSCLLDAFDALKRL